MALNDIKVPRENAQGAFDELVLTPASLGAAPATHASTHHTVGADAIAPSSIGAQTLFTTATLNLNSDTTLTAARATNYSVINSGNHTITLPTTGHLVGDIVVVRYTAGTGTLNVTWGAGGQTVVLGAQYRFIATGTGATNWTVVPVDTHTHTFGTTAGTFTEGNDARLSDSRTPTAHAASHAAGGSDPLAPSDIGAQSIFITQTIISATTLTAQRARIYEVMNFGAAYTITMPSTDNIAGDTIVFRSVNVISNAVTLDNPFNLSDDTLTATGQQLRYIYSSAGGGSWQRVPVDTHTHAAADITSGTLAHERGGLEADVSAYNGLVKIASGSTSAVGIGTGSTEVAAGDHGHGNLTNDGKLGSTAGLPVVTTTAGSVTTLALGTANQVLRVNSGASGVEFADPAASGVTGAASSASDVLGVSGANITGVDANADRIVFWDDSASALKYLEAGSGLSISGTTLTATSTFDPASPAALGTTTPNTGAFTSLSTAPAANTSALTTTGYSLTGSNAQSLVDLDGTWNTTGTPSAIKLNVTDTASNASSLLMQLQTGGTNRLTVSKAGAIVSASTVTGTEIFCGANGSISGKNGFPTAYASNTEIFSWLTNNGIMMGSGFYVGWSSGTPTGGPAYDVKMFRDAAAALALRDGTNAQESRLYGTWTSSTNYQRMTIKSVRQTLSALSGASATTTGTFIPDGAVVVGVTTRVATALTGATGYTIGDGTDADRWGDITGTAIGTTSDNRDWTAGTVECFTAGGNITLTAKTSNFTAGAIEICVFYLAGEAD